MNVVFHQFGLIVVSWRVVPNSVVSYSFDHSMDGFPSYSYLILDMTSDVLFDDVRIDVNVEDYTGLVNLDLGLSVGFLVISSIHSFIHSFIH